LIDGSTRLSFGGAYRDSTKREHNLGQVTTVRITTMMLRIHGFQINTQLIHRIGD
jgi:hypothetical protein